MNKIKKVLIANRSEIASRIIFTCKTLGIKTVAICSEEDHKLSYVYQAEENYTLSGQGAYAYLAQEEIIHIAKKTGADAIHPGYGFLSENATFAQRVIDAGLTWIGPTPKTITQMGDKIYAKQLMQKAGVPIIPGFYIKPNEKNIIKKIEKKIGFPIVLKDPLGGGGKGLRKVHDASELQNALDIVSSEAKKLSGSTQLLVEKYITHGRHIEIQIAGDGKEYVHLYERECSIQRRHQKIIEETPCNFVPKTVLEKMYKAALLAAQSIQYDNIGTVEFIVTPDNQFYFLEMNTRLQVEHSITEATTGIDLVALQIHLAQTNTLPYTQHDIVQHNHAIECRIYAEDPKHNFAPSTGQITHVRLPHGPFIRHDHNLENNQTITPFFDPMISKITTWGKDRNAAIKHMLYALNEMKLMGIKTNIDFLKQLLATQQFLTGAIHTQLLQDRTFMKNLQEPTPERKQILAEQEIARIIAKHYEKTKKPKDKQNNTKIDNWRLQQWR